MTQVNGMSIERDIDAYTAFQSLRSAPQLRVTFVRGGAKHELVFYEPGTKKDEDPKPAKKVKDGCWTFLNLPNGVQLTMRIVGIEAGKPKLLFAAKRED